MDNYTMAMECHTPPNKVRKSNEQACIHLTSTWGLSPERWTRRHEDPKQQCTVFPKIDLAESCFIALRILELPGAVNSPSSSDDSLSLWTIPPLKIVHCSADLVGSWLGELHYMMDS